MYFFQTFDGVEKAIISGQFLLEILLKFLGSGNDNERAYSKASSKTTEQLPMSFSCFFIGKFE